MGIRSKAANDKYRSGWEKIFAPPKKKAVKKKLNKKEKS